MSYKVVTISNRTPHEWYYLQKEFYKSLEGNDVLTINRSHERPFNGLATKPKWLYSSIKAGEIKEKYIILVDNWDVVFGAEPKEVMLKYFNENADIVISGESNCFPDTYKKQYDEIALPMPYRYLNSGVIVGSTDAILACLEAMDLPNVQDDYRNPDGSAYHSNDQTEWQKIFLMQPVKIVLDYNQSISQTLHNAKPEDFNFSEERIRNVITNSKPSIWHFNGGSKDNLSLRNPILNHLNLL